MKKILLLFVIALLSTISLFAQNISIINEINSLIESKIGFVDELSSQKLDVDPFVICNDNYFWDAASTAFVKNGDGEFVYEHLSGGLKKLSIKTLDIEEDGIAYESLTEVYYSANGLNTYVETLMNQGDSTLLYIENEQGDLQLFVKLYNTFEDGLLMLTESYIDLELFFGIPTGFVLTAVIENRYDNNDYLINSVDYNVDLFGTGELTFTDSTAYNNRADGLPLESVSYQLDEETGLIEPLTKTNFTYNNLDGVSMIEDSYYLDGAWVKQSRSSFEYDGNGRRTSFLSELTEDNGTNWINDARGTDSFDKDLPLQFPTSELVQEFDFNDNEWVNSDLSTYEDCTSSTEIVNVLDFKAWINGNSLMLEMERISSELEISISDLHGRMLYKKQFESMPNSIDVSSLIQGLYLVRVEVKGHSGVQKVFR